MEVLNIFPISFSELTADSDFEAPTQVQTQESKEGTIALSHSSQADTTVPPMACILKSSIIDLTSKIAPLIFPSLSAIVAYTLALTPSEWST